MSGQVLGYVRVSSGEQKPARQTVTLGPVDETFTDTVSGKNRTDRPALAELLRHVRRGDTVRVASMDRLARSVIDLTQLVAELTDRGITVEFVAERLTFSPGGEDPFATFQLHLLGAVAQLERSLIRERQRESIEIAKANGVYRGRSRKLTPQQVVAARDLVTAGVPKAKVARDLGCSTPRALRRPGRPRRLRRVTSSAPLPPRAQVQSRRQPRGLVVLERFRSACLGCS